MNDEVVGLRHKNKFCLITCLLITVVAVYSIFGLIEEAKTLRIAKSLFLASFSFMLWLSYFKTRFRIKALLKNS